MNTENAQTETPKSPTPDSYLRLDEKTVERRTANYPDAVREPILWLAAFTREKCGKNLSSLEAKCRKLKLKCDYTYFYRIFTGKYFQVDPANGQLIGSVPNLLRHIEVLRKQDRIDWRAGKMPFITTPTAELIFNLIDKKCQPGRVNRFGSIIGPTGSQKSSCFKEYKSLHDYCVHIEAPEKPRMGQFLTDLAVAYGEPRSLNQSKKIFAIHSTVNEKKCIIVDNVQRLYLEKNGGEQTIFNFLQKLQDDTGCTIIMSYTPDFVRTLQNGVDRGYFEQFIGRMGGLNRSLVLPDYTPAEDLLCIANAYGLQDAEKHVNYLDKIAHEPGRIRIVFEDLQDAKQLADSEDKPLTIDHLRLVRGEEVK